MGTVDIDAIVARLHKLEEENSRLKTLLSKHGISYEESKQEPTPVVSKSDPTFTLLKCFCLVFSILEILDHLSVLQINSLNATFDCQLVSC